VQLLGFAAQGTLDGSPWQGAEEAKHRVGQDAPRPFSAVARDQDAQSHTQQAPDQANQHHGKNVPQLWQEIWGDLAPQHTEEKDLAKGPYVSKRNFDFLQDLMI